MMKFPMPDGGVFAIIEPGNIQRLKDGRPLLVGNCMVCFTPDMKRFAELLGVENPFPPKGEEVGQFGKWTAEQIDAALKACQKLPEVQR